MSIRDGHCNGTMYLISSMSNRLIKAQKLNGSPDDIMLIPRIPLLSKENDFSCIFSRLQFPVILAYYLTFNRAQGQSLERCGLLLPQSVFNHGLLYTGFSRCGDPMNTFVYANQEEFEDVREILPQNQPLTRNVVYPEAFN